MIWFEFDDVEEFQRKPFATEVVALVEAFHLVMVQLPDSYGTEEHVEKVASFRETYEDFLDHYRGLERSDVVRFVAKTGPKIEKVERDLTIVLDLYESKPQR